MKGEENTVFPCDRLGSSVEKPKSDSLAVIPASSKIFALSVKLAKIGHLK